MKFYAMRFVILLSFCLLSASAFAQEDTEKLVQENQKKVEEDIKKETPITQWIDAENKVLDALPKQGQQVFFILRNKHSCLLYTSPSPRDGLLSRMPSSA